MFLPPIFIICLIFCFDNSFFRFRNTRRASCVRALAPQKNFSILNNDKILNLGSFQQRLLHKKTFQNRITRIGDLGHPKVLPKNALVTLGESLGDIDSFFNVVAAKFGSRKPIQFKIVSYKIRIAQLAYFIAMPFQMVHELEYYLFLDALKK